MAHTGNSNIVVDAVAGCGKTTTILGIAQYDCSKKVLCLTYNRALSDESKERAQKLGLDNMKIYTVHSFVYNHYCKKDNTDRIFHLTLQGNIQPTNMPDFDILVLDEFQDFHETMVMISLKIMKDSKWDTRKHRLVLLGDKHQCIYDTLHDSDERYLTFAQRLFGFLGKFDTFNLHTTFRLTSTVCDFVNDAVLSSSLLKHTKVSSRKPVYFISNPFTGELHNEILGYLEHFGALSSEIFVLSPSVKSDKSPVMRLVDKLSNSGYNIYKSDNLDVRVDKRELDDHVCVTTYHSCKGRERKFVILFGFDKSYFKYFEKEKKGDACTNAQYVALTRSCDHLLIVHDNKSKYLDFVNVNKVKQLCDYRVIDELYDHYVPDQPKFNGLSVTELLEYQTYTTLSHCEAYFDEENQTKLDTLVLPNTVKSIGGKGEEIYEGVSDLNGTLVTVLYEYRKFKRFSIMTYLQEERHRHTSLFNMGIRDYLPSLVLKEVDKLLHRKKLTVSDIVKMVLLAKCCQEKVAYRLKQLEKAKMWLTDDHESKITSLFDMLCSDDCEFEKAFVDHQRVRGRRLMGLTDIIDHKSKCVYEVKCVDTISLSHKVQLMCYAYLLQEHDAKYKSYSYILYNIKSGERIKLTKKPGVSLQVMVDYLIHEKYRSKRKMSDEEFLAKYGAKFKTFWNA